MTPEQVILHLDGIKATTDSGQMHKAIDTAINSINKQIPKKPIHITGDDCPNCNYSVNIPYLIGRMKMKYCRNCGQAIDWGEENE